MFDADPGDPHGLDPDLDGIACETPIVQPHERGDDRDDPPRTEIAATPVRGEELDIDCIDFEFQEEAQTVYDQNPGDPYNLDPSGDGLACSSLPSRDNEPRQRDASSSSGRPHASQTPFTTLFFTE